MAIALWMPPACPCKICVNVDITFDFVEAKLVCKEHWIDKDNLQSLKTSILAHERNISQQFGSDVLLTEAQELTIVTEQKTEYERILALGPPLPP